MAAPTPPDSRPTRLTCKHLLAPLQIDDLEAQLLNVRNWRKCAACGVALWDDGSEMAYITTGPGAASEERKDP